MPKPLGMTKLFLMRLGFDERERSRLEMFGAARDVLNQVVLQTCLSRRGQILIDRADARVPVAIERLLIFRTLKETINYVDPPSCSEAVPFDTVDCHIHPRRGLGRSALVAQFYERSHAFAVVASCHRYAAICLGRSSLRRHFGAQLAYTAKIVLVASVHRAIFDGEICSFQEPLLSRFCKRRSPI